MAVYCICLFVTKARLGNLILNCCVHYHIIAVGVSPQAEDENNKLSTFAVHSWGESELSEPYTSEKLLNLVSVPICSHTRDTQTYN